VHEPGWIRIVLVKPQVASGSPSVMTMWSRQVLKRAAFRSNWAKSIGAVACACRLTANKILNSKHR